jgi:hypothetical protein
MCVLALQVLQADADVLLVSLLALLTSGNEESMCEAAKAVGNLARASPAVRAQLVLCADTEQQARPLPGAQQQQQQQEQEQEQTVVGGCIGAQHVSAGPYVLQSLVLLLDHSSWEVVCSVAGALVNLAALPEAGAVLSRMELAAALTAALQRLQEAWEAEQQQQQQQQQGQDDSLSMQAAAELLLQCVGNMAAASAAAVSEAILGSSGARCAELSCSAEDLAGFSRVLDQYAECGMPQAVCQTAKAVQGRLAELWGV